MSRTEEGSGTVRDPLKGVLIIFPWLSLTNATTTVPSIKLLYEQQFPNVPLLYWVVVVYSLTKKDVAVTPNCELADASELN